MCHLGGRNLYFAEQENVGLDINGQKQNICRNIIDQLLEKRETYIFENYDCKINETFCHEKHNNNSDFYPMCGDIRNRLRVMYVNQWNL